MRPERTSLRRFQDALYAFSNDPTPSNLQRYLAASRALAEAPRDAAAPEATPALAVSMTSGASAGHF
jgi:hypothetical protein